jgi:hypothetical protein
VRRVATRTVFCASLVEDVLYVSGCMTPAGGNHHPHRASLTYHPISLQFRVRSTANSCLVHHLAESSLNFELSKVAHFWGEAAQIVRATDFSVSEYSIYLIIGMCRA